MQPPEEDDLSSDESLVDEASQDNSGPWVVFEIYWDYSSAHIARLRLEAEGIPCALIDEHINTSYWLWAHALGGIKLIGPEKHAATAKELITTKSVAAIRAADGEPLFDGNERCPRCGCDDIFELRFSRRVAFLSLMLIGIPIPFLKRAKRCCGCGMEWRVDP